MKKLVILMIFTIFLTGCTEEFVDYLDEQIEEANKVEVVPDELPEDNDNEEALLIPAHVEEETEAYYVDAKYPQWEYLDTLNYLIEDVVYEEINDFKDETESLINDEYYMDMEDMKSGLYIDYEIYYNDWDYLSIGFTSYWYSEGAAHGNSYTIPFNLDFEDFEQIELADIFQNDTDYFLALSYMTIPRLKDQLYEDEWADDYLIEAGAGPDPDNFQAWTLTGDSIIFHFDPYQVAAYAAGPQKVEFTFYELYALLQEPWASRGQ